MSEIHTVFQQNKDKKVMDMTKTIEYATKGTCSRQIKVQLTDGVIDSVQFVGGCNGNTKGISQLVKGMKATDVIERLSGTKCGPRSTSCPDQLAKALEAALAE
jgi:uncharacterized protein (TIGR03905 family)